MYKLIIKPLLFILPAEKAHYFTTGMLSFLLKIPGLRSLFRAMYLVESPSLKRQVFGLQFPNPVGLAAGFDKNASMYRNLKYLGFGFIEIGTVTPLPQSGNPKPRLFRLPNDNALINRMGFNNLGLEEAKSKLRDRPKDLIIGGNIGKNKVTPNEKAIDDYMICFEGLFDLVDYFVVNVSSPNTPNLRALQDKKPLTSLLNSLMEANRSKAIMKPILLKIAPDLSNEQLDDIINIVRETKIDGLIATNTTISRDGLSTEKEIVEAIGAGGLSGAPLRERATEVIRYLKDKSGAEFPIIGVGGISTPDDAEEKLNAGATLIQVYSGLIYEGPAMVSRINRRIAEASHTS